MENPIFEHFKYFSQQFNSNSPLNTEDVNQALSGDFAELTSFILNCSKQCLFELHLQTENILKLDDELNTLSGSFDTSSKIPKQGFTNPLLEKIQSERSQFLFPPKISIEFPTEKLSINEASISNLITDNDQNMIICLKEFEESPKFWSNEDDYFILEDNPDKALMKSSFSRISEKIVSISQPSLLMSTTNHS